MKGELNSSDIVVSFKLLDVVKVINIINVNLVLLTNFEVVLDVKLLDPLGRKVIHDNLGVAKLSPGFTVLFEEHCHSVGTSKSIQVG